MEYTENDIDLQINVVSSPIIKALLITSGTISVGIGIIGIFLPLLPTTPFLLLAAACYARSSKRFYVWLLTNKYFGKYIRNYREGKGIPLKTKLFSIGLLWITITISIIIIKQNWISMLLIIIALLVSWHIVSIPTYKGSK